MDDDRLPSGAFSQLPDSSKVNVAALTRLFASTTNSYKYLFFLSLLDMMRRRHFEATEPISFQDLIVEMLANAWFPHTFFKLSFGTQDKVAQKLDALELNITEPIIRFRDTDKTLLRGAISLQDLGDVVFHLSRYVPFRLIAPFLEHQLAGVSRGKGNQLEIAIPAIANRCFNSDKPLYRFNSEQHNRCQAVIIHPAWASYLEEHIGIVRGWAEWEWLTYMQKRNPSTPAIANKLFVPTRRDSLTKQTDYWKLVLRSQSLRCIYSQQVIDPSRFSLDHYLPWSFVAHDQLWNLIPTLPEVNSAKSNNLPSNEYFAQFVTVQHSGLLATREALTAGRWETQIEPFINDLGISALDELLDVQRLGNAYERIVKPLVSLATNQGFSVEWRY